MEIPLWIILVPLAIVVALTALFLFFNVFHLARYGVAHRGTVPLILVYLVSYAFVLVVGVGALGSVLWTRTIPLGDLLPFSSSRGSPSFGL